MNHAEDVHAIDKKSSKGDPPSGKQVKQIDRKFCGKKHLWKKEECPTWGKTCAKCGERNHFAGMCGKPPPSTRKKDKKHKGKSTPRGRQTSKVNMVGQQDASDSDNYCLMVESVDSVYDKEAPKKRYSPIWY